MVKGKKVRVYIGSGWSLDELGTTTIGNIPIVSIERCCGRGDMIFRNSEDGDGNGEDGE
jgi:hypothetical protein